MFRSGALDNMDFQYESGMESNRLQFLTRSPGTPRSDAIFLSPHASTIWLKEFIKQSMVKYTLKVKV